MTGNPVPAPLPRTPDQPKPARRKFVRAAVLWLAGAIAFLLFALLAHFYDRFPGDERITDAFQDVDVVGLGGYLSFVNSLGDTWLHAALLAAFVVLLGLMRAGTESVLALYTLVPSLLNGVIKDWVQRPRPSEDLVAVSDSFGFPSAHTVGTAGLFLVLFFAVSAVVRHKFLRWTLQAGCLLMMFSAGPARVYVGVHWPSDVLAGYALVALMVLPLLLVHVARRSG